MDGCHLESSRRLLGHQRWLHELLRDGNGEAARGDAHGEICRTDPAKWQAHHLERHRPGRSRFARHPPSLEKIAENIRQFNERPMSALQSGNLVSQGANSCTRDASIETQLPVDGMSVIRWNDKVIDLHNAYDLERCLPVRPFSRVNLSKIQSSLRPWILRLSSTRVASTPSRPDW